MSTTTSEKIALKSVRLSFARLFVPKAFSEGQQERYEGSFLLDPSDKSHAAIIAKIVEYANGLIGVKWEGEAPAGLECCFQYADGEEPIELGKNRLKWRGKPKTYDGYEGMFVISSANTTRPTVVDRDRTPLTEADGKPYSGAYVNGSITLWVQDNKYGQRINANLRAVQFVKDGEAFGVRPADAEEEFDVLDGDDDDDFLD
jgi:hypothetical protein